MKTEDCSKQRQAVAEEIASPSKINELPIEPLTHVASFLPLPSRALLAISLAAAPCTAEKIIAAEEGCETTLDFGSMEKDLAVNLNDEELDAILRCIDAANQVKILRLTNCINISGVGLESLRGSEIIEKIDFTLVADREVQRLDPQPPISLEHVVPILDSIIESRGSSLKHLQFPIHWRKDTSRAESEAFNQFLDRFNQYLSVDNDGWKNRCAQCDEMDEEPPVEMFDNDSQDYGVQYRTCSVCTKHHCDGCCYHNDDGSYMYFCTKCERAYCSDCSEQYVCERCDKAYCVQCRTDVECSEPDCDVELCDYCRCTCLKCQKPYCDTCFTGDDDDDANVLYGRCSSGQCYRCYDNVAEEQVSNDIQNNDNDLSAVASHETTTQPDTAEMQQPQMMDGAMASGPSLSSTGMQQHQQDQPVAVANNATTHMAAASGTATAGENPSSSNDFMLQNQNNDDDEAADTLHPPAATDNTDGLQGNVFVYFTTNNSATAPLQSNASAAASSSSTVTSTAASIVALIVPAQANSEEAASSSSQQTRRSKRKKSQQGGRENTDTDE